MKNSLLLLCIVLFSGATLWIDPYSHWFQAIESYNSQLRYEKVYLNTDKTLYLPGETIWFSGFILDATDHTISRQSDVLHVDIIAPNGSVAETLVLPALAGLARGSWEIKESMPGGRYMIRAYTRWMKNFGESEYFEKLVPVQRATLSRLLMTLDFARDGYGPGDSVVATLDLRDRNGDFIPDADLTYEVRIDGAKALASTGTTNQEGKSQLRFILPETLDTPDGILEVAVRHGGIFETITRSIPIRLNRVDIRFFPEGGSWTYASRQKIGFKAVDAFGNGADISGEVRNEQDEVVASFTSLHKGIGSFEITAEPGHSYTAYLFTGSDVQQAELPEPEVDAYQLRVEDAGENRITLEVTVPVSDSVMVLGRSFGRVAAHRETWLPAGTHSITLPLDEFSTGVGVFTLFDNLGLPVCERLWYVRRDDLLNIKIIPDKDRYLPGEDVTLSIHTSVDGKPVPAQLSLRVADETLLEMVDDKQDHLLSYMLLSSEVHGKIEEPIYYFDSTETDRFAAMDNLLLTQGWRRYNWKELNRSPNRRNSPERVTRISGRIKRKYGKTLPSKVRLVELNEGRRIIELETNADGSFAFEQVDPESMYMLVTNPEYNFQLDQKDRISQVSKRTEVEYSSPEADVEDFDVSMTTPLQEEETELVMDVLMDSDVSQLSEVVVTGYGTQQRSLTGAVSSFYSQELSGLNSIEETLQGRVAGVRIIQNGPVNSAVMIRGYSSLRNYGPLVVIDGIPVGPYVSGQVSPLTDISPNSINTISVIRGAEATALYGSAATEGVIIVTTRTGLAHRHSSNALQREKFTTAILSPYQFSFTKEFYQPDPTPEGESRKNFNTTLFWDPVVVTDEQGKASVTFHTNDALTLYKVTAEGFSPAGNLGIGVSRLRSYLPVSAEAAIPDMLGLEDTVQLPVRLTNMTNEVQVANVSVRFPDNAFSLTEQRLRQVTIGPGMEKTIYYKLATKQRAGRVPVEVRVETNEHSDVMRDSVEIRPMGIPESNTYVSNRHDTTFSLSPISVEGNTLKVGLDIYPNLLADLFTGAESLLREPHGCFEQVSATTFPNILALQYMKATNTLDPEIRDVAHEYLEKGFQKLRAYEIRGGGFEWFGHPPAHEGLTAFGLIEFYEMNKVHPLSDPGIIERTRKWLLSRRDGKGGFNQASGKYGFSGAKEEVTNAYIVYALSVTETKENILPEYERALREAWASKDMYRMALMANAAHYLNREKDYERLTGWFRFVTGDRGYQGWQADHSIVRSHGPSLTTETLAFWTLALLQRSENMLEARENVDQLLKKRSNGRFGNSQATTVSLMALTRFARLTREMQSDGEVIVYVNERQVRKIPYSPEHNETIRVAGLENYLDHAKENSVRVEVVTSGKPVPVALTRSWSTLQPENLKKSKVGLTTRLAADLVEERRSVRLEVVVSNEHKAPLPMTLARINIPAGLELQVWQLRELQEDGVFDYYEVADNELYLYWRELDRATEIIVPLDLKAVTPGKFRAGASSAYLYYADDVKTWVNGESVRILPDAP